MWSKLEFRAAHSQALADRTQVPQQSFLIFFLLISILLLEVDAILLNLFPSVPFFGFIFCIFSWISTAAVMFGLPSPLSIK
jgi:hypothetical protein